jgi:hypothetical protein
MPIAAGAEPRKIDPSTYDIDTGCRSTAMLGAVVNQPLARDEFAEWLVAVDQRHECRWRCAPLAPTSASRNRAVRAGACIVQVEEVRTLVRRPQDVAWMIVAVQRIIAMSLHHRIVQRGVGNHANLSQRRSQLPAHRPGSCGAAAATRAGSAPKLRGLVKIKRPGAVPPERFGN